jgi:hypothetical protein
MERRRGAPRIEAVRRDTKALGLQLDIPWRRPPSVSTSATADGSSASASTPSPWTSAAKAASPRVEAGEISASLETVLKLAHRLDLDVGPILKHAIVRGPKAAT